MSKKGAALILALLASTALAGCTTPSQEADTEAVDTASIDATDGTGVAPSATPTVKSTPAKLELVDATVSATQVHPNDLVSLRFEIQNVGSKEGSFAIQLLVNGEVHVEKSYRVAAGAPETGSLDFRPSQSGTYTLSLASSVLGESGRTQAFSKSFKIKVSIPPNLQVIDATSSHKESPVGESVSVVATVANSGEESGSKEIRLMVEGKVEQVKTITVGPNGRESVVFEFTKTARGLYTIAVEERPAGVVTFFLPAKFEPLTFTVTNEAPELWETIGVNLHLRNVGDREGTVSWTLKFGGQTLRQDNQLIGANSPGQSISVPALLNITSASSAPLELWLNGQLVLSRSITPKAPVIAIFGLTNVYGEGHGWNADDAHFTIYVANNGTGRAPGLRMSILVDGSPWTLRDQPASSAWLGLSSIPARTPSTRIEQSFYIELAADFGCDPHTLEVRVTADFLPSVMTTGPRSVCL